MHTEGHDAGKETVGGTKPLSETDSGNPGYELTDVNVGGVVVFLAGLFGFVIVFFFFCFGMGKVINNVFIKQDGEATSGSVKPAQSRPVASVKTWRAIPRCSRRN